MPQGAGRGGLLWPPGSASRKPAGRLDGPVKSGSGRAFPHLAVLSPRGGLGSLAEPAGKAGLTLNFLLYTCQLEPRRV